ncbi:hypothetical protein THAOC_13467 [Thalassiosira oceanica]|uniref:Uncharacterized protein n=1 Tax=Thalassiosira oceanica TaxID=159749 RepID=K0SHN3_THAOC|nr:hypothetical protein THAOC_13467 [Thalassiosira oceanica]|eukprot:EJK65653.1 hypothetical protein THAOC_13467 [Thalassiosira oceanica]
MQELARRPSESPRPSRSGQSGWPCPPSRHGGAGPGYAVLRGGGIGVTTRGGIEKLPLRLPSSDASAEGCEAEGWGGGARSGVGSPPPAGWALPVRDLESEGKGGDPRQSGGARGGPTGTPSSPDGRAGRHGRGMNGPWTTAWPDPVRSRRSVRPHSSEARRRELVGGPTRRVGSVRARRSWKALLELYKSHISRWACFVLRRRRARNGAKEETGRRLQRSPVDETAMTGRNLRLVDSKGDLTRSRSMIAWSSSSNS